MNLDTMGFIVTAQKDGGDTCAEEGRYWFLYWFNFVFMHNFGIVKSLPDRGHPEDIIDRLEVEPGIYVRNPNPKPFDAAMIWETDPTTTSRDQLKPIIWYCAAFKDRKRLLRLFWACLKRGMFAQDVHRNWSAPGWKLPDQMWTCLGNFIRAGGWYTAPFYPALLLFDLIDLLGNAIWLAFPYVASDSSTWYQPWTWFTKRDPGSVDDNNTDIDLLGAVAFKPTPISWLNRKMWAMFRPRNDGNIILRVQNRVLGAMAWYHDPINQGNKEVVELYTAPILKYFSE